MWGGGRGGGKERGGRDGGGVRLAGRDRGFGGGGVREGGFGGHFRGVLGDWVIVESWMVCGGCVNRLVLETDLVGFGGKMENGDILISATR